MAFYTPGLYLGVFFGLLFGIRIINRMAGKPENANKNGPEGRRPIENS